MNSKILTKFLFLPNNKKEYFTVTYMSMYNVDINTVIITAIMVIGL